MEWLLATKGRRSECSTVKDRRGGNGDQTRYAVVILQEKPGVPFYRIYIILQQHSHGLTGAVASHYAIPEGCGAGSPELRPIIDLTFTL